MSEFWVAILLATGIFVILGMFLTIGASAVMGEFLPLYLYRRWAEVRWQEPDQDSLQDLR